MPFYRRHVREVNSSIVTANQNHIYVISPSESGTIFTARGSEGETGYPLIYILPPIENFHGLVYTFQGGPTSEFYVFAHRGKATTSYGNCEIDSKTGVYTTPTITVDRFGVASQTHCLHWSTHTGFVNSTIRIEGGTDDPWGSKGGIWFITNRVGVIEIQDPPGSLSETSYDWYEMDDRYPAIDGNTYSVASTSNIAQPANNDKLVMQDFPGGFQYHINKTQDYTLRGGTGYTAPNSIMRGTMVPSQATEATLRKVGGEWGANIVRYQTHWGAGTQGGFPHSAADDMTPAQYKTFLYDTLLPVLDARLTICEDIDLKLVLDIHYSPGGIKRKPITNTIYSRMFEEGEFQTCFLDIWAYMAQKYKGNTTIWAFDLANEVQDQPDDISIVAAGLMDWNELASAAAQRIRAIDPDRKIIMCCRGGPPSTIPDIVPISLDNIYYSFHLYNPTSVTHQGIYTYTQSGYYYPGLAYTWPEYNYWDTTTLRADLQPVIQWHEDNNIQTPFFIGEFSCTRYAPGTTAYDWLHDNIEYFEEQGWHWCYHAVDEAGCWDLELPTGPANSGVLTKTIWPTDREWLLRKYFQRNDWDSDSGAFVTNSGATADTIFTLPSAQAGLNYRFTCQTSGGCYLRVRCADDDIIENYYLATEYDSINEIYTDIPNAYTELLAINTGIWHVVHQRPDWTAVRYVDSYSTTIHVPGNKGGSVSDYYIQAHQTGTIFTTSGNTTACTFHLPKAQGGLEYQFLTYNSKDGYFTYANNVGHAYETVIKTAPGDGIYWPGYATPSLTEFHQSGYNFSTRFFAADDTGWYTIHNYGTGRAV